MSLCGEITSGGTPCRNKNCHLHGSNIRQCSICLNPVRKTRGSSELRCGHSFHKKCINEWKAQGQPTCPDCRKVIDKYRVTIRIENIESAESNVLAPLSSLEVLEFVARMGLIQDFTETQLDVNFENDPDLHSFFRDLNIRLADLNPAIFDAE